jgi:hypothetical protein
MGLTKEADEIASEPCQNRLNVVIARIECEDLLGLGLALLLDDGESK